MPLTDAQIIAARDVSVASADSAAEAQTVAVSAATDAATAREEAEAAAASVTGTDLAATLSASSVVVTSSTGTDATIPATDASNAGVFTPTQKGKLDGIASGATANSADATLLARANHTGTQTAATISDFSTAADARITAAVGTTVQAYDADLAAFAAKTAPTGAVVGTTDAQTLTNKDLTAGTNTFPTLNQSTTGSAAKWTTGRTVAITGDLAYTSPSLDGSANVTAAGTLATVNSNTGSFGSASQVATFTVNGKGLTTAAASTAIAITASQVTDFSTAADARITAASSTGTGALVRATSPALVTPTGIVANDVGLGKVTNRATLSSRLTAAATNSTVTYAGSGLSVTVLGSTAYRIRVLGTYQSAATTTGFGVRLNGTATATALRAWSTIWGAATSVSTPQLQQLTALASGHLTTTTFAANSDYKFEVEGVIRVNAGGTLILEFASEVAASQVTIQADASMIVEEMA